MMDPVGMGGGTDMDLSTGVDDTGTGMRMVDLRMFVTVAQQKENDVCD